MRIVDTFLKNIFAKCFRKILGKYAHSRNFLERSTEKFKTAFFAFSKKFFFLMSVNFFAEDNKFLQHVSIAQHNMQAFLILVNEVCS